MFLKLKSRFGLGERTDEELLRRFALSGEGQLIGELFTRYTHLLFAVAFNILKEEEEAKDAVMKVFEKLMTRPSFEDVRNFKPWICTVTKNQCVMELRHRNAESRAVEGTLATLEHELTEFSFPGDPGSKELPEVKAEVLLDAVSRLIDEQKTCIELFYLENKSYAEIVHSTGYDMNYVKSYIQNGKRNLKKMLENGGRQDT